MLFRDAIWKPKETPFQWYGYLVLPTQFSSAEESAHSDGLKEGPIWGLPSTDWVHLSTLIISCDNIYCWFISNQTQCDTWIYVSCSPCNLTGNQRPNPEGKRLFPRTWLLCKGWWSGLLGPGTPQGVLSTLEGNLSSEHYSIAKHNRNLEGHPWGKQGICSLFLMLLWLINGALWMKRGVSYGIINIHLLHWSFFEFFSFFLSRPICPAKIQRLPFMN